MPSDEEIKRVRHLIDRIKNDLAGLTGSEREQITQAVATVRRTRATIVQLGLPSTRQPLPDLRGGRTA